MARKNNMKLRRKKNTAVFERAEAQERRLLERKTKREGNQSQKMDMTDSSIASGEKPLKRKAQRRLENEMARLARKGIKLVKQDEEEMDDGDRRTKRARTTNDE